jgi:hypothetical protein
VKDRGGGKQETRDFDLYDDIGVFVRLGCLCTSRGQRVTRSVSWVVELRL